MISISTIQPFANLAATYKRVIQGVSPMHNILVVMLQTIRDDTSQPANGDNGAIWHHMSDALHQSLYRVLSLLIAILPGILAFFVALGVFTLIGKAISSLLRRGFHLLKLDDRLARAGVNRDWTASSPPSES